MNLKILQTFDLSYFRGKSHFVDSYGTQDYSVFQPIIRYFKRVGNTDYVLEWKSKGLSDKISKCLFAPNEFLILH